MLTHTSGLQVFYPFYYMGIHSHEEVLEIKPLCFMCTSHDTSQGWLVGWLADLAFVSHVQGNHIVVLKVFKSSISIRVCNWAVEGGE